MLVLYSCEQALVITYNSCHRTALHVISQTGNIFHVTHEAPILLILFVFVRRRNEITQLPLKRNLLYYVEVQKNKCVIVTSLRVLHKHSECWTWSGIQVIFFKWMLLFSAETLESFCHRNLWREIALGLPHYIMTCREQRRRKWSSPVTQNQILTQNTKLPLRCNFMHTCMVVLCTCKYASMI